MTPEIKPFLPALVLLLVVMAVGVAALVLSSVVLPWFGKARNPKAAKLTPYECGVRPLEDGARRRYSVKFYMVAMLFILFDVEAALLLPWAVAYRSQLGTFGAGMGFFATLGIGWYYLWQKGALDWEK